MDMLNCSLKIIFQISYWLFGLLFGGGGGFQSFVYGSLMKASGKFVKVTCCLSMCICVLVRMGVCVKRGGTKVGQFFEELCSIFLLKVPAVFLVD